MSDTDDIADLPYLVAARVHCLRIAAELRSSATTPAQLIEQAKVFEDYVTGGTRPTPPAGTRNAGARKGRNSGHANRTAPDARA